MLTLLGSTNQERKTEAGASEEEENADQFEVKSKPQTPLVQQQQQQPAPYPPPRAEGYRTSAVRESRIKDRGEKNRPGIVL
jgi:hypothetical protein